MVGKWSDKNCFYVILAALTADGLILLDDWKEKVNKSSSKQVSKQVNDLLILLSSWKTTVLAIIYGK